MTPLPGFLAFLSPRFYFLFISFLVAILCSWLAIWLARKLHLIDVPNSLPHKQHARPTPIAGGIALFLSMLVLSLFLGTWSDGTLSTVFIATGIIFVFGLLDDRFGLSAPQKLFGQGMAVAFVLLRGVSVRFLESPEFYFGGPMWLYQVGDWFITAFWLIGIINAFNLVDSMDGLAVGLASNSLVFLLIGTSITSQSVLNLHMLSTLGICLGILFFNMKPARLFLGDSGAQPLGALLALFSILYNPVGNLQASTWFFPILVLGIPIFDTTLVVYSRTRRRKPFYKSNLDHTYHRLVKAGLSPVQSVLLIHSASVILGIAAFVALHSSALLANLIFLACILLGIILLYIFDHSKRLSPA